MSGNKKVLPKIQENVRKIDKFLVMPGKCLEFCMISLVEILHILCFSVQCEKRVECKIKTQDILHSFITLVSVELVSHAKYTYFFVCI